MFRTSFLAASIAVISTTVLAQADLIAARKAIMGETGKHMYRALPDMVKGAEPYDQAAVDAAFTQMTEAVQKLPALYAESTKDASPSGRFSVSPKMWQNKADFDARLAKYAADVAAAKPKATSLDALKEIHPMLLQNCSGCHDEYRIRN